MYDACACLFIGVVTCMCVVCGGVGVLGGMLNSSSVTPDLVFEAESLSESRDCHFT